MKFIEVLLAFIFAVVGLVGKVLLAVNVLQALFLGTGSFVAAIVGFCLWLVGGFLAQLCYKSSGL